MSLDLQDYIRSEMSINDVALFTRCWDKKLHLKGNFLMPILNKAGNRLLTQPSDRPDMLDVRNMLNGQSIITHVPLENDEWRAVAFSERGDKIVIAASNCAHISDPMDPFRTDIIPLVNNGLVHSVGFNQDGTLVITGSEDRVAKLWNAQNGALVATLNHDDPVLTAQFNATGSRIVTATAEAVNLWDAQTHSLITTLEDATKPHFNAEGTRLLVFKARSRSSVYLVETGRGEVLATINNPCANEVLCSFSPTGPQMLVCASGKIQLWDTVHGLHIADIPNGSKADFTKMTPHLITYDKAHKMVFIWDPSNGHLLGRFTDTDPLKKIGVLLLTCNSINLKL